MSDENINQKEKTFDTDFKYAIVAGWLIIPAIHVVFSTLGSILIVMLGTPSELDEVGLITYIISAVSLVFLALIIYSWLRRKRFLPILMIIFYTLQVIDSFYVYMTGYTVELFYILVSVILIVYFIRSKRVKATFTE